MHPVAFRRSALAGLIAMAIPISVGTHTCTHPAAQSRSSMLTISATLGRTTMKRQAKFTVAR
jgi:hypothetical protein